MFQFVFHHSLLTLVKDTFGHKRMLNYSHMQIDTALTNVENTFISFVTHALQTNNTYKSTSANTHNNAVLVPLA